MIFSTLARNPKMNCCRSFAHAAPTRETDLPIKSHDQNAPTLPVTRKGQSGKVLLCPQQNYPATSVAKLCTAVLTAARRFFKEAIGTNGVPDRVVIDNCGAILAGLQSVNVILKFTGTGRLVTIRQVKYLNNIPEQGHRFINRITGSMMGFKAFHSATASIAGIEVAQMIRKRQFEANDLSAFQQFAVLAA